MTSASLVVTVEPLVWRSTVTAEHESLLLADPADVVAAATHFTGAGAVAVTVEDRSGAVSVLGSHDDEERAALRERHRNRAGGRLFRFTGSARLHARWTVRDLLRETAIDELRCVGDPDPVAPDTVVDTQSFVRPTMEAGRVRLVCRPAAGGVLVPFEQPDPTPCCADH